MTLPLGSERMRMGKAHPRTLPPVRTGQAGQVAVVLVGPGGIEMDLAELERSDAEQSVDIDIRHPTEVHPSAAERLMEPVVGRDR